ncbi:hypothetical protein QBC34DRAFT_164661 [Podospora aff. communis PSN243]|uniref:Uncharacterized protein n=1 Tax=Podospora aff. communis PSN243 TaxID=3040156 RepID=A0AAV9GB08_9PEZI|nr:hypothetical protein QBC34DRAFT_164661 [Podospora aff. communis PSN243]
MITHRRNSSTHSHRSLKSTLDHLTHDAYFGEEIDFVVGLTATALTADQVLKMRASKHHKAMHLVKAGIGAAAATTAFSLMAREHAAEKKHRAEVREKEAERGRARERVREWERNYDGYGYHGRVESLTDSEDEEDRRMVRYGGERRGRSVWEGREGSRLGVSERRAFSHSPVRGERRRESRPRLERFLEAVRDSLEEREGRR